MRYYCTPIKMANQLPLKKEKNLRAPNTCEFVKHLELSFLGGGMQNGTATLDDCLAVSYKIKHTFTIQSSNHILRYTSKYTENLHSHKNLHTGVFSSIIHNCQYLEATKMSFSRWMNRENVLHPDWNTISVTNK